MGVSKISFILLIVAWSVQGDAEGFTSNSGGQEPDTRVVGGKEAPEKLVPHQVALQLKDGWTFCGAAVISDRWILTAAHCVKSRKPADFMAVVGTLSRTKGGTKYEISKVIPHKEHNKPNKFKNDIAVISTKKAIEFNKNVQPLPLPTKDIKAGLWCILSGWGKLGENERSPDKLQYLYVRTLTGEQCNKYFKGRSPVTINSSQMCTLNKRGEGTCQGDSGGSLVCNGTSAGIVSFNWPCANNFPDTYANTYKYNSWIKENTKSP
ncbi:chymotrypsin-1-like isoform X2 [Pieris rapae]|uniref:chymotrypsin-1-like isoform X2 n=1 Tax=Pieris rapae TaxID=64459 RepID=UPI001E27AAB6|nr:chymotrypsin-1-like isoform X2 [Pieris rapae]